jgi:hypothetical protein
MKVEKIAFFITLISFCGMTYNWWKMKNVAEESMINTTEALQQNAELYEIAVEAVDLAKYYSQSLDSCKRGL